MRTLQRLLSISNCRIAGPIVGGGDTAHGALPRLVSPPTGDNLEYTRHNALTFVVNLLAYIHKAISKELKKNCAGCRIQVNK
jgi:hypothetical protein